MKKNMKLSTKLILGFGVMLVVIGGIAVLSNVLSTDIKNNAELSKNESVVFAGVARQMKLDVVGIQQWLPDFSG